MKQLIIVTIPGKIKKYQTLATRTKLTEHNKYTHVISSGYSSKTITITMDRNVLMEYTKNHLGAEIKFNE
jgi:hypothetical protein